MKIDDEIYKELTDIYWDVLSENKDISMFETEFYSSALDDGFELDVIEEYWRM